MCGVLGCKRIDLYVNFERVLNPGEIAKYREYVRRRGRNEPLAYILGTAAFCGRDFSVTPSVLIPRPETELLVEHAIPFLKTATPTFIADIGTGSGCIGITFALGLPEAEVVMVDVSGEALEVARRNAHEHGVHGRAHLVQGDLSHPLRAGTFHAVVANLPYVAAAEKNTLPPDVVEFEPHVALFGGETGLDLFEHLLARGLEAQAVALIVSDGARGLPASMKVYFPNAKHQRCITHKVRGMQRYLLNQELPEATPETSTYQLQQERWHELKTDAYTIYEAATREEAQARLTDFEAKWQTREPQAVHSFVWGFQATLHFYHFESHLHPIIRTTNHLERLFREFRNKADEIGAFPNEQSCLTLFFLVVQREHAKHDRPFMAKT
ncbi:MAG TPA: peptide chain release factor N(5)-glutamine methyltransferase [Candidatus Latescibacteria bacterium]|nr:peptide chain release factor N(5)-glutamine methyltransferase [Candidatus Latescibacterota bacterium]